MPNPEESEKKASDLLKSYSQQLMSQGGGNTLQPQGFQMGAIGHPNGVMPPTKYSATNQL